MWQCIQCRESVDDELEVCWNCGTSVDGTPDPNFERDPDAPLITENEEVPALGAPTDATPAPTTEVMGMTRHEIATLVCKSIALGLFAYAAYSAIALAGFAILFFYSWLFDQFSSHYLGELLVLSLPTLSMIAVGILYWKKADSIASRMVRKDARPVILEKVTVVDLMMVIFATVGLYTLVQGLHGVSQILYLMNMEAFDGDFGNEMVWSTTFKLGVGVWLMLGSRGVVNAIVRLRRPDVHAVIDE
jgi:hypothetical protein